MTYPVLSEYEGIPPQYQAGAQWVPAPEYQGGGYFSDETGEHLDYAQLEKLWIDAGGSAKVAPQMAYIAEYDESGGYTGAWNSTGATGLWQIEYPSNYSGNREDLFTPLQNAEVAVQMYDQSGYSPWGSDVHEDLHIPPASVVPGGAAAGSPQAASAASPGTAASLLGIGNPSDALQRLGLILLGAALVLLGVYMLAGRQALKLTPAGRAASAT